MTDLQKEPKVSIVCAWYNRADYIRDTVDSLLNQDFDDYEIIIANDGSPDPRVKEILDSYDDPKLTVIHKDNEGFTKTIKMLVEMARAPYVAIQGAGDISYPSRLMKQYEYLASQYKIGAVGSGYDVDLEGGGNLRYVAPQQISTVEELKNSVPFTHGTIMYRKTMYLKSGGYDTRFKYCSDWDLYFRILKISRISSVDRALYKKIEFDDGFSFSPFHKILQLEYKKAAIYRKGDRESYIDKKINEISSINIYNIKYLKLSLRFCLSNLKWKRYRLAWLWLKMAVKQMVKND